MTRRSTRTAQSRRMRLVASSLLQSLLGGMTASPCGDDDSDEGWDDDDEEEEEEGDDDESTWGQDDGGGELVGGPPGPRGDGDVEMTSDVEDDRSDDRLSATVASLVCPPSEWSDGDTITFEDPPSMVTKEEDGPAS